VLAEGSAYVERAPWTVLAPAGALVLVSVLSVGATALLAGRSARAGLRTPAPVEVGPR
jgi:peptide/nickel transport system permease protein